MHDCLDESDGRIIGHPQGIIGHPQGPIWNKYIQQNIVFWKVLFLSSPN